MQGGANILATIVTVRVLSSHTARAVVEKDTSPLRRNLTRAKRMTAMKLMITVTMTRKFSPVGMSEQKDSEEFD